MPEGYFYTLQIRKGSSNTSTGWQQGSSVPFRKLAQLRRVQERYKKQGYETRIISHPAHSATE